MRMSLHSMGSTGSRTKITVFGSKKMHLKLILGHFCFFNVLFIDCYKQRSPIAFEFLKRLFRLTEAEDFFKKQTKWRLFLNFFSLFGKAP